MQDENQDETKKPVMNHDTGYVYDPFNLEHPAKKDCSNYSQKEICSERGIAYEALLKLLPEYGAIKLLGEMGAMDQNINNRFDIIIEYIKHARDEYKDQ